MTDLKRGVILIILLTLFTSNYRSIALAYTVHSVETKGTIGFYGQAVSENDPDPLPPSRPEGESSTPSHNESAEVGDLPLLNQLGYR